MLSRRIFLNLPVIYTTGQPNNRPNHFVYVSKKNNFQCETYFEDHESAIKHSTKIEWYDPVTKQNRQKIEQTLYITDSEDV
jgi:hypothetical protein